MGLDHLLVIFVCVSINYIMLIPVFYFILGERVKTIDKIIASKNPRKRLELAKTRDSLEKDKILALGWPMIFFKGFLNASRKKK